MRRRGTRPAAAAPPGLRLIDRREESGTLGRWNRCSAGWPSASPRSPTSSGVLTCAGCSSPGPASTSPNGRHDGGALPGPLRLHCARLAAPPDRVRDQAADRQARLRAAARQPFRARRHARWRPARERRSAGRARRSRAGRLPARPAAGSRLRPAAALLPELRRAGARGARQGLPAGGRAGALLDPAGGLAGDRVLRHVARGDRGDDPPRRRVGTCSPLRPRPGVRLRRADPRAAVVRVGRDTRALAPHRRPRRTVRGAVPRRDDQLLRLLQRDRARPDGSAAPGAGPAGPPGRSVALAPASRPAGCSG